MTEPQSPAKPATSADAARIGVPAVGLLTDYNRSATAYWCLLAGTGAVVLALAAVHLWSLPSADLWQILTAGVIAAVVGLFPLRVPKTKTSFAVGDIFIFLLLLLYGPFAAVVAATAEAAACAWRTSTRLTSRIAGPAAAAVAMLLCGQFFVVMQSTLVRWGLAYESAIYAATLVFALAYFVVSPTLVTTVIYLKRWRAPSLREWLTTFGWLGMGYLASASIATILHLAFRQFGPMSVVVAVPMIGMFVASLRVYFSQQEAAEREVAERASIERADNAERESRTASAHLKDLELSERRFQSAFAHAAIGMALVSPDGRLVQVNAALCAMLGLASAELLARPLVKIVDTEQAEELAQMLSLLRSGAADRARRDMRCQHAFGHEVWASMHCSTFAPDGATEPLLILQAFDITAQRQAEGRLQHLAYHDVLTGLANRSKLLEALQRALHAHQADPARLFSVLHLSFDRFKQLSDSFGRGVGDRFLVAVALRIQSLMRPGDLLARLEGDDFAILAQHGSEGTQPSIALAERVHRAFAAPVLVDEIESHTNASIGIRCVESEPASADSMLRDADLAMSKARADGRGRHALYDPKLHQRASDQLMLESDLRRALAEQQIHMAFQPVFSIEPHRIAGFEALARWQHPVRGAVSPADFIPVAEQSGLITQLTYAALTQACAQLQAWRSRLPAAAELFVNVNIAGQDLCEAGFADFVRDILARHALPARCLTLEITETALMQQLELGSRTLARLRDLGVGLSVDDFGTGYSSLSHLSKLPINSLKIDRSFIDKLDGVSMESEIVRAVIQLGQALGKRVVAEGIETPGQLAQLRKLDCGYAQGFLLARPLSVAQVDAMLPEALAVQTLVEQHASWCDDPSTAEQTADDSALCRIGHAAQLAKRPGGLA